MDKTQTKIQKKTHIDYHLCTKILFSHPFISTGIFGKLLKVTRQTASQYTKQLEKIGVIEIKKIRKTNLVHIPEFIKLLS